ncbi:apolipoprotein N-acyltransferase [Candidatus Pelagibacter sp.]|nr:apolipoprotein N-acyltransferase [Candidatus Pelagibacter sp.]
MKKNLYIEFFYLVILGALTSLSLPPYNFLFINFFTFSAFFIFIFKKKIFIKNKYTSFFYGWSFGFGYFLSNMYWITISLTYESDLKYLIPFALILIPSFLAIFYGLITLFLTLFNLKGVLSIFFLFSLFFGLIEFIRGTIFTGFPWNLIAYSFTKNLEILQSLSLIGTYSFNLICVSLFTSPAIFFLKEKQKDIIIPFLFLLLPFILYLVGSSKIKNFQSTDLVQNDFTIRAIGSNISLDRFYRNVDTTSVINELIELSAPNPNLKILFLWPEGIIPNTNQKELINYKTLFENNFNENHFLGMGINSFKKLNSNNIFYNSFSIYDNKINLISSYQKVKLVPFGEFLPYEDILKNIGFKSLTNNYNSYKSGITREIIKLQWDNLEFKILPLICYEIIYSGKLYNNPQFDFIINISEDGWFGNSIGPVQHFSHSIFRAVESGKYIIRSSNNGITAIINPVGIIEKKISLGNSGHIDFTEKRKINSNFFSRYGNKMFLLTILLYIFLVFSFNRKS